MSKYLRNYENLDVAKADETIVSPNVTSIADSRILHLDTHVKDEELAVIGDSLANARIVKKYIADTTSNPELIVLARSLGWIDSGAEKMRMTDAMAVTTVNDSNGHSLLSNSGLKSFDEFEYFTGVTGCPGINEDDGIPSLPNSCTSIKLPESIVSIGDGAFGTCESLKSVTISNSVVNIGDDAFNGCTSLESIEIPDSVTNIGDYAFAGNDNLTSVTIGNSVKSIGNHAFFDCMRLTSSVVIPNSVKSIGVYAFESCNGLTSVKIGNGVTGIGGWTFQHCGRLTSVTIPDSVTGIGQEAFANCSSLTSITFTGTSTQWKSIGRGKNWHYSVPATTVVYCEGDKKTVGLDER